MLDGTPHVSDDSESCGGNSSDSDDLQSGHGHSDHVYSGDADSGDADSGDADSGDADSDDADSDEVWNDLRGEETDEMGLAGRASKL